MIERQLSKQLEQALTRYPVVALLGPRQVGKTTLARAVARANRERACIHLDLERPSDLAKLADPELYLEQHRDALVILDEVQRVPGLFPVLRALVDSHRVPGRFLVLGSAAPELLRQSAESLAGRIRYLELTPLTLAEVGADSDLLRRLWLRGGYPESFLAESDSASLEWREAFVATYLERDVPALGLRLSPIALRRFWLMLAHRHGQLWNASALAASLGTRAPTVERYLDLLCNTYLARRLPPYHANLEKRLVKSPKIYLRDSGLLHALLGIGDEETLHGHPVIGFSWEGFIIEQVLALRQPRDAWFFRTAAGAEIDLLLPGRSSTPTHAIEIKYALDPKPARGFWSALKDLTIEHADVVYPGKESYPLTEHVQALPAIALAASPDIL